VSAPATATAGSAFTFTVTALDAGNHTATSYSGMVHFTSSDGEAALPANATLTDGTFSATLRTSGSQMLYPYPPCLFVPCTERARSSAPVLVKI
jgi:hypothetical protein